LNRQSIRQNPLEGRILGKLFAQRSTHDQQHPLRGTLKNGRLDHFFGLRILGK